MFYFGSNTKRDLSPAQHFSLAKTALKISQEFLDSQIFLLPAMPLMQPVMDIAKDSRLWVGNQSISSTSAGDVTGEVSAKLLKALGSNLVLIGHAERRRLFDDDSAISSQLKLAKSSGLRILFCIGEKSIIKDKKELRKFFRRQLRPLANIQTRILLAYEPVFSIGVAGKAADPRYIENNLSIISEELLRLGISKSPILYGGSVDANNARTYASLNYCDGLFVGRSAWSARGFRQVFLAGYSGFVAKD
ncbi:MAG: triosephosphate isomerase [Actinobacteria bacterium]|nr:triosephosphate isomerase [Actinomycetota bacterium]